MRDTEFNKIKNVLLKFAAAELVTDELVERFYRFYELMIETNKVKNLTAITDFDDVLSKHFEDSLSVTGIIKIDNSDNVLDLGTGAGFPGIPLKLLYPDVSFSLLDSLQKRMEYLEKVCSELKIRDCSLLKGRAEDFGRDENYREKYSVVVSRAVANLAILSEYALPFVRTGGVFVAYKSNNVSEEIKEAENAISALGGEVFSVTPYDLGNPGNRRLVAIRKVMETPLKYPRRGSAIKKRPIK